jgi:predicted phage terminase large subunit-like protein
VWRWIERATAGPRASGDVVMNRTERFLEVPTSGGFLGVYSADNDVGLRGEAFHLAVLEEAARIGESTWTEVVQPALADYEGYAVLISTPMGRNWFWREWQEGYKRMDGEMAAFTAPSSANPMPGIQRAYRLARVRVPDNVFRQEWDAEFVADAFDLFTPEQFPAELRYDPDEAVPPLRVVGRYASWDTAFSEKEGAAFTACVVGELLSDYTLRIVDVWRDRLAFPRLLDAMQRVRDRWRPGPQDRGRVAWAEVIESKASGTSAYQTLAEALPEDDAPQLVPFLPTGSKEQRASQAAVWCQHGRVRLPRPHPTVPWLHALEAELFAFPHADYADQVDAFSMLLSYLEHYLAAGLHDRTAPITAPRGERGEV